MSSPSSSSDLVVISPSSSSDSVASCPSSSSRTSSSHPTYIQLPPPPCFSPLSFSPSHFSPDPFDRTPTSPSAYYTAPSSSASSAPASPLKSPRSPPPLPALHITIPSGPRPPSPNQDPTQDEAFPATDMAIDMALDDEGLSALEKIYLFSRSSNPFHRVFIVHAMPSFLEQVTPLEADEYVLPLLRGLALDHDETVKEALAIELVPIVWWFFTHCQIVPDDVKTYEYGQPSSSATNSICVQAFTPILGTLLLSPNPMVGGPARQAVVEILSKIRKADIKEGFPPLSMKPETRLQLDQVDPEPEDELVIGLFGKVEREMVEQELLQQVIIGMGRLDMKMADNFDNEWSPSEQSLPDKPDILNDSRFVADVNDSGIIGVPPGAMDINRVEEKIPMLEDPPNPYISQHIPAPSPPSSSPPSTGATSSTAVSSPSSSADSIIDNENGSNHPGSTVAPSDFDMPETSGTLWLDYDMMEDKFYHAEYHLPHEVLSPTQTSHSSTESSPGSRTIALDYDAFSYPADAAVDIDDYGDELDVSEEQAAAGRVSSMSLMAAAAASDTLREPTKFTFVKEVERVGRDPVPWVRREASFALGALAKVIPQELVVCSLLPVFEFLRRDPVWHVRQSALFALPAVLSRLSPKHRRSLALETIIPLSKDASSNVRSRTLEALGEVIYTFHEDEHGPPDQILHLFLGRRDDRRVREGQQDVRALENEIGREVISSENTTPAAEMNGSKGPLESFFLDQERPLVCTFNFPAVVLTLGKEKWYQLRDIYLQLANNRTPRVRRTVAAGLGAIAKIIGEEYAAADLLPIWWNAIKCEEEEVRVKAVECVGELISALSNNARLEVVRGLLSMWVEGLFKNWRERESLAKVLGELSHLVGLKDAVTVRGLLMTALHDAVAAIREAAVAALPLIWMSFSADSNVVRDLHDDVLNLAQCSNYRQRMTFVSCQHVLIAPVRGHSAVLVPDDAYWLTLIPLAQDKITGVRIGIARLVGVYLREFPRDSHHGPLSEIINTLRADDSHEVRSYVPSRWALETTLVGGGIPEPTSPAHGGKASIFSKPPLHSLTPLSRPISHPPGEATSIHATPSVRWLSAKPADIGAVLFKLQQLGERISPIADNQARGYFPSGVCAGREGAIQTAVSS